MVIGTNRLYNRVTEAYYLCFIGSRPTSGEMALQAVWWVVLNLILYTQ